MGFLAAVVHFLAGAVLTNAVPHFVSGVQGKPFQSPFAKPPGKGLSSASVNVLWGFFNLLVGYLLVSRVGHLNWRHFSSVLPLALGVLVMALLLARTFGPLHGGDSPRV